jgi:hypothetical protein
MVKVLYDEGQEGKGICFVLFVCLVGFLVGWLVG